MRIFAGLVFGLTLVFCLATVADAQKEGNKEVTLKGKICCPKCELGTDDKCATVIVVKKGDKETVYYFDKDAHGKYHKEICTQCKDGSVVGIIGADGGKKTVKVKEVKFE